MTDEEFEEKLSTLFLSEDIISNLSFNRLKTYRKKGIYTAYYNFRSFKTKEQRNRLDSKFLHIRNYIDKLLNLE